MKKILITILLILCLLVSFGFAQHKSGAHKNTSLATLIAGAVQGDIIYWDGTAWVKLNIGASTEVLTSNGTIPGWAAGGAGGWTDDGTDVRLTTITDNVNIGVANGTGKLNVLSTTEQFRLSYDATNYMTVVMLVDGHTTFTTVDPDGAEADMIFNPDGNVGIGAVTAPAAKFVVQTQASGDVFALRGTGTQTLVMGYNITNTESYITSIPAGWNLGFRTANSATNNMSLTAAGDLELGVLGSSEVTPILSIISDADSDAEDTDETFALTLTQAPTPTDAVWTATTTQSAGFDFDMPLTASTVTSDAGVTATTQLAGSTLLLDMTQDYLFTNRSNAFALRSQAASTASSLELYSNDADGTDNIIFSMYSLGHTGSIINRERLYFVYLAGNRAEIYTEADGTGTLRPLVIYTEGNTDQLHLDITGGVYSGLNGNEENYLNVEIFNDSTVTGETTWSSVLPAGFKIESIIFKNTTSNEITNLDIGFSDAGGQIVAATNLLASDEGSFTINQEIDDFDAADDIFISADNWNSANIIIYIRMVRIF